MAETILCGTSRGPREGLWIIKISNICLHQNSIFIKFLKILKIHEFFFVKIRKLFCFVLRCKQREHVYNWNRIWARRALKGYLNLSALCSFRACFNFFILSFFSLISRISLFFFSLSSSSSERWGRRLNSPHHIYLKKCLILWMVLSRLKRIWKVLISRVLSQSARIEF